MCRVLCSNGPATHLDLAPPLCVPGGLGQPTAWDHPTSGADHGLCPGTGAAARPQARPGRGVGCNPPHVACTARDILLIQQLQGCPEEGCFSQLEAGTT